MTRTSSIAAPARRGFLRRRWKTIALVLTMVLLTVALVCLALLYTTPAWYQPLDPRAEDLTNDAVSGQLKLRSFLVSDSRAAKAEDRSWSIRAREINALLASRFPTGEPTSVPSPSGKHRLGGFMVRFEPGYVTLAARASQLPGRDPDGGVLSLRYGVRMLGPETPGGPNRVHVFLDRVWINSLPIPRSFAQARIDALRPLIAQAARGAVLHAFSPDEANRLLPTVLNGIDRILRNEPFSADTADSAGRHVRLKDVTVEEGALLILLGPPQSPPTAPAKAP